MRFIGFFLLVMMATTGAWGATPTRVALICSADEKTIPLIEASLNGHVELVERSELAKALAEQKLSIGGLIQASQAVQVGQIVHADLLVTVARVGDPQPPGSPVQDAPQPVHNSPLIVTAFDAHTGVRLCDTEIVAASEEAVAQAAAAAIRTAADKRGLDAGHGARTVCLLTVRNADLPLQMEGFCQAIGSLLERRLIDSPGITILERSHLDQLTKERALPTARAIDAKLLTSLNLVELQIGRDPAGSNDLRVVVMLSNTAGNAIGKREVICNRSVASLTAAVVPEVLKLLGSAPAAEQQPVQPAGVEAVRFFREGVLREQNGDMTGAVRCMETAHALVPESAEIQARLAATIARAALRVGREYYGELDGTWTPEQVERAFQLMQQSFDETDELTTKSDPSPLNLPDVQAVIRLQHSWLANLSWQLNEHARDPAFRLVILKLSPQQMESLRVMRKQFRTTRVDREKTQIVSQVRDAASLDRYSVYLFHVLREARVVFSPSEVEACADYQTLMLEWVELLKKFQPRPSSTSLKFISSDGSNEAISPDGNTGWPSIAPEPVFSRYYEKPGEIRLAARKVVYTALKSSPDAALSAYAAREVDRAEGQMAGRSTAAATQASRLPDRREGAPPTGNGDEAAAVTPAKISPMMTSGFWDQAGELFDSLPLDAKPQIVQSPCVYENAVLALIIKPGNDENSRLLQLTRFSLDGSSRKVLGEAIGENSGIAFHLKETDPMQKLQGWDYPPASAISGGWFLARDGAKSVWLFSVAGGAPKHIQSQKDWPAQGIRNAVATKDKIYLALQEAKAGSFLLEHDLRSGADQLLASSRRKEKLSPFDDSPPMSVEQMIEDPDRNRLVFYASNFEWESGRSGIYEFNLQSRQFKQLAPDNAYPDKGRSEDNQTRVRFSAVYHDRFAVYGRMKIIFNLTTDRAEPLPSGSERAREADAMAVTDGAVWSKMQRFRPGKKIQSLPQLRMDIPKIFAWPSYLCPIDERQMLVADTRGMWVVSPPDDLTTRPAFTMQSDKPPAKSSAPAAGGGLPWSSSRVVYDYFPGVSGYAIVVGPLYRDGFVYAVGSDAAGNGQLIKVKVEDGTTAKFGQVNLGMRFKRADTPQGHRTKWQCARFTTLLDNAYFVSIQGRGVKMFPLDGSPGQSLETGEGIIQPIGGLGTRLFVGIGGAKVNGRLLMIDTTQKGAPVEVTSPQIAEKHSVLDGVAGLHIDLVEGDASGKRILFLAYRDVADPEINGLYSCSASGDQVKRILPLFISPPPVGLTYRRDRDCEFRWGGLRGKNLVMAFSRAIVLFNIETGETKTICRESDAPDVLDPQGKKMPTVDLTNDLLNGRIPPGKFTPPFDLHDNWLWTSSRRVSLDGKTFDSYVTDRNREEFIQVAPDGRSLLSSDQLTLWSFQLKR